MYIFRKNLLLYCIFFFTILQGQDTDYKFSLLTTGVSMSISKNHKLTLYGGISGKNYQQFFRVYPAFKINKYLTLIPGYTYSESFKKKIDDIEHQIMAIGTVYIPLTKNQKWTLVDRNMYYHRLRKDKDDASFYRNRIALNYKTKIAKKTVSFFLDEEIYLSLDGKGITRNQITFGGDIKLNWITPQIIYIHQKNKGSKVEHLVNLSFVIPLENFGFFVKK